MSDLTLTTIFQAATKGGRYEITLARRVDGSFECIEKIKGRNSAFYNWNTEESAKARLFQILRDSATIDGINYIATINLILPEIGRGLVGTK